MSVPVVIALGILFAVGGVAAERLASVWPSAGARRRGPGIRTVAFAAASGVAAGGIAARSALPWWATAAYLAAFAVLVVLSATDLEQRRLPHLLLDPLIVLTAIFIPFNPAVVPLAALIGAVAAVALLAALTLVVRGGLARGDLYLVLPLGFLLGFPAVFSALFAAALMSALASVILLAQRRVGMRSYIPFGPFLVAGAALVLLVDDRLLRVLR